VVATNKLRQRERFDEVGVPQPRWQFLSEGVPDLAPPCVVKAPDRQGQKGLSLVLDAAGLDEAIAAARASSRTGAVLIEEVVDGPEVTVIGFSAAGEFVALAVTDRLTADPPAFGVALSHVFPSPHAEVAANVARLAVEALGIDDGPSYTQLRLGPRGPEVMEVAARLGGGHDAELVREVVGVDLNGLALAAALGEPLTPHEVRAGYELRVGGAVTRFLVSPPGVLESVSVPGELEGVVSVRIYREPGYLVGPFRRGTDRAGAVLVVGATREEALARADAAAERIRFVTADAEALV
jgi:biotin carboxylase